MAPNCIGTCAICLEAISPEAEAFVETCLHHFCFDCIQEWVRTQQTWKRTQQDTPITCPICKRGFDAVIYDCIGSDFCIWTIGTGGYSIARDDKSFSITAAHRRRRSIYLQSPTTNVTKNKLGPAVAPRITGQMIERHAAKAWLIRELQALLLQHDVDILAQHLIRLLKLSAERSSGDYIEVDDAIKTLYEASQEYVPQYARQLAQEFTDFLASGLTMEAHDRVAFELSDVAATEEEGPQASPLDYLSDRSMD